MYYQIDRTYLLSAFQKIVSVPSPVGYYTLINPLLAQMAEELGAQATFDARGNAYIRLEGQDTSKTVLIGAHADTLGMMVHHIDPNGMLRVSGLGGINYHSLESETVTVHTRGGRTYTGLFLCQSHSVHVFDDARTLERDEKTMVIVLDEDVSSAREVRALGIRNGDYVSVEPRCHITENGYVKSRFIDDKAGIACCFTMLKYLADHALHPKYNTILAFPHTEEIGFGGSYVPEGVSEYVALDIGLIGPNLEGSERKVSISARDHFMPYDYALTSCLIAKAEKAGCDYALDVFSPHYGSDCDAALRAGHDLKTALFGMAVYGSHGMERTHIDGLAQTTNLLLAYVLDL